MGEALRFIRETRERDPGKPFFAYVGFNAPHTPLEIGQEYVDRHLEMGLEESFARLYGMVENIDENVGRALDALEEMGLSEDTLVVFTSDHGPCGSARGAEGKSRFNCRMRGIKGTMFEGGLRVPCFLRWPGGLAKGRSMEDLANPIDWLPTLAELVGLETPGDRKIDGRSWAEALRGERGSAPRFLDAGGEERLVFMQWHRGNEPVRYRNYAAIGPRFKVLREREEEKDQLYDVLEDPREETDLAGEKPELVARYRGLYEEWLEDVSGTRPDNYAPPAIAIGEPEGDPVYLTWQDWRLYGEDEGWSSQHPGYWEVELRKDGDYALQIEVDLESGGGELVARCQGWEKRVAAPKGGGLGNKRRLFTIRMKAQGLRAGRCRLHAYVEREGQRLGVGQVKAWREAD